jgi:REP element-mobilizing transposase RayT
VVAGYHLIWTAYGWWCPNDPRGSSSHEIRVERIAGLRPLHLGRKKVQPLSAELRRFYDAARGVLKHDLLEFRVDQFPIIAAALGEVVRERRYICCGCALMPDHVHLMIRKHLDRSEEMLAHFRAATKRAVIVAGVRDAEHPVWGGLGWKVFLNTRGDTERTDGYIRGNPEKAGLPAQQWEFVTPYTGWMPFTRET